VKRIGPPVKMRDLIAVSFCSCSVAHQYVCGSDGNLANFAAEKRAYGIMYLIMYLIHQNAILKCGCYLHCGVHWTYYALLRYFECAPSCQPSQHWCGSANVAE